MLNGGWERVTGTTKTYRTTQQIGGEIPKGFEFEVSVPRFLWWLIDPHDPEWLGAALWHDFYLEVVKEGAVRAAEVFLYQLKKRLTRRRRLIWPAYISVLLWTTLTPPLRRFFFGRKNESKGL